MSDYSNKVNHYVMSLEFAVGRLSGIIYSLLRNYKESDKKLIKNMINNIITNLPENYSDTEVNKLQDYISLQKK